MVTVKNLIDAGLLIANSQVSWRRRGGSQFLAEVLPNGFIKTSNGQVHKSPSGAARSLVGRPVDGWAVWRVAGGKTLASLRAELHQT